MKKWTIVLIICCVHLVVNKIGIMFHANCLDLHVNSSSVPICYCFKYHANSSEPLEREEKKIIIAHPGKFFSFRYSEVGFYKIITLPFFSLTTSVIQFSLSEIASVSHYSRRTFQCQLPFVSRAGNRDLIPRGMASLVWM